jgi:hypothetical protein
VAPSEQFKRALPRGKLPDRNDFKFYGINQDERIRIWRQAIADGQRLRDDFARFVHTPDLSRIRQI